MEVYFAGWTTGTESGKPAGPPPGAMWAIAFTSSNEEERVTLATYAETVMQNLGAQDVICAKGYALTYVSLRLTREQVHERFEDTNWQTLSGQFINLFERELLLLKSGGEA